MGPAQAKQRSNSETTLLASLLLSSPAPVVTGISAISGRSATLIADFARRTAELIAVLVSWLVYRKIHSDGPLSELNQKRLERLSRLFIAFAMLLSGVIIFAVALFRLSTPRPYGNVTLGLAVAMLGLLVNICFWFRYGTLLRNWPDIVLEGQRRLYAAKVVVDIFVVSALIAVIVAPLSRLTSYLDAAGSGVVALYLLWSGTVLLRDHRTSQTS